MTLDFNLERKATEMLEGVLNWCGFHNASVREYLNMCVVCLFLCVCVYIQYVFAWQTVCLCVSCAHNTQALIIVQLLVFFPVEQQSEAFSAKALVNNSGLILFAAVSRKTGH